MGYAGAFAGIDAGVIVDEASVYQRFPRVRRIGAKRGDQADAGDMGERVTGRTWGTTHLFITVRERKTGGDSRSGRICPGEPDGREGEESRQGGMEWRCSICPWSNCQ